MDIIIYIITESISLFMGLSSAMKYLPAIMAACILMAIMNTASGIGEDISDLKRLISGNEDTGMNSRDLAFFLITHNYNAVPKDGYAELNLNATIYRLIPNGEKSGLCDVEY
jgi:predicted small secreted protein